MSSKVKALVVFSGGLDSILAVKILQAQNIAVEALCFESNFYKADKAREVAQQLAIPLQVKNIEKEMLTLTKNPVYGYGKNMNPCIDCHGNMFKIAGKIMEQNRFDVLATGEVLGQRPFSQNKDALRQVEKIAGIDILRPLSAKLLPETYYEKNGLVNRGRLERISGRSRDVQMELIRKYKIDNFPTPSGGCLLTDPEFSNRLLKLFDNWSSCQVNDIELLKHGRVFWFEYNKKKILVLIGRHYKNNENLEKLAQKGDYVLQLKDINGPTALIRGLNSYTEKSKLIFDVVNKESLAKYQYSTKQALLLAIAKLTAYYAIKARGRKVEMMIRNIL